MKKASLLFLFLIINLFYFSQFNKEKNYFLIEDIKWSNISNEEKIVLNQKMKLFHLTKNDTIKINILFDLINEIENEELWPKYSFWMMNFIKSKLKSKNNNKETTLKLSASIAQVYEDIAYSYRLNNKLELAFEYYDKSLKIFKSINNTDGISKIYNIYGYLYDNLGKISLSLDYYFKSLKIREKSKDYEGTSNVYLNIGAIYDVLNDKDLALEYYNKSLNLSKKINNFENIASSYNNIGRIYNERGDLKNAFKYYNKCLEIDLKVKNENGMAFSYRNLGSVFENQNEFEKALTFYYLSLELSKKNKNNEGIISSLIKISQIQLINNNIKDAKINATNAYLLANQIGFINQTERASKLLYLIEVRLKNWKTALEMRNIEIKLKDSISNENNIKSATNKLAQYEFDKTIEIRNIKQREKDKIVKQEKFTQNIIIYFTLFVLLLLTFFFRIIYKKLQLTKKQKSIIENQKSQVEIAHQNLEEKNREILDSITYAKRIQSAILPQPKLVKEFLEDSFILYKPKDIVAGDFYWLEVVGDVVLFAAADCTGHGVPGAMVSVVCNNGLNRAVREFGLTNPNQILDKTRELVVEEFEKSDEDVKDGMDISLCSLNTKTNLLEWAGANNPLWILRNQEIIEYKPDKQPIGKYMEEKPFSLVEVQLEKNDIIYIFTDGFQDQFGGLKEKKFRPAQMKELFLSLTTKSMEEQRKIIDLAFEEWKGDLEQVDDVCVIGVRI